MISDMRKSFMIAPIDCRATTFDSSHEDDGDESDAGVSTPTVWVAGSGDNGDVIIRTLILRVKDKRGSGPMRTSGHTSAQNVSRRRCIYSALSAGSWSTSRHVVRTASETP